MRGFFWRWFLIFICVCDVAALPEYDKAPVAEWFFQCMIAAMAVAACLEEWIDYFVKKLRNEEEDGD